ncbi:hypothetical protein BDV23DRAFT_181 [Aspergillus alliaceus]|uniref:Uncharacterized protein n=1 Tax=Petromyces alliaceus TaxID=209559 RepID=A0A5N7CSA6_PETAA|nr:hypothetical protein BDV23DRAFT_181 [Aspergillus alliaceus]
MVRLPLGEPPENIHLDNSPSILFSFEIALNGGLLMLKQHNGLQLFTICVGSRALVEVNLKTIAGVSNASSESIYRRIRLIKNHLPETPRVFLTRDVMSELHPLKKNEPILFPLSDTPAMSPSSCSKMRPGLDLVVRRRYDPGNNGYIHYSVGLRESRM